MNIIAGPTIRGINIQFGAETTALTAALADVNRQGRNLQGELSQVQRLLRMDPGNTTLIAQQQRLLGEAVENSREKLNRLRTAQEQVDAQFARGEISEQQYRAFQREVAASEQQLRRLEGQLNDTGRATRNLGQDMQQAGDKMKGAGEKMTMGLTAPIVAAGAVLTAGAIEAEAAASKIQASLGITAEEAEKLSDAAREVWSTGFVDSMDEANKAIISVKQNMAGIAENEIPDITTGAAMIAQTFEEDVAAVTASAGVAMKNFGISGQEALDLLTVGFQKGGNYSGELLDSFREYAPQFAAMGINAEQAMGMLIAGAEAGAFNLDKVGDSMKEFNIRAQDGSKLTVEGFTAIGLNADEMGAAIAAGGEEAQNAFMATVAGLAAMDDKQARNTAGVALFGTQWEDVKSQVIIAMAEGMEGLDDFQGATDAASKALEENNPGLALTQSFRALQVALEPILTKIVGLIVDVVVPALKSMADWFANLSPAGQTAVLAIAGIAAAIGPLLIVAGMLMGAISAIAPVFAVAGAAIGAISAPVVIAVAAIAGIIAIGYLVMKNWDEIAAKAREIWAGIKNYFSETWESIKSTSTEAWGRFKDDIFGVWESIKSSVAEALSSITTGIAATWNNIKTNTAMAWKNIVSTVTTIFSGAISEVVEIGKNIVKGLWEGIKSMATWIYDHVSGFVSGIIDSAQGMLGINSPSKVFAEIGKNVSLGMARGIASGAGDVKSAIAGMMDNMQASVSFSAAKLNMVGAGASNNTYNSGGNNIYITVQDGEDLLRTLHRAGVRISNA